MKNWRDDTSIEVDIWKSSRSHTNLAGTDAASLFDGMASELIEAISRHTCNGSGWMLKALLSYQVHTAVYKPLRGRSYIQLPKKLATKKAIINMKNTDD